MARPAGVRSTGAGRLAAIVSRDAQDLPEYRLGVAHRAADHLQHIGRGGLLFPCLIALKRTLRHIDLQVLRPTRVIQRDSRMAGQKAQAITVRIIKAARRTVDIGVQEAKDLPAHHQRCHQARALVRCRGALGSMAQARRPGAPGLGQPGRDGTMQCARVLARGQFRSDDFRTLGRVEQQQYALGATDPCRRGDHTVLHLAAGAQCAHLHGHGGQLTITRNILSSSAIPDYRAAGFPGTTIGRGRSIGAGRWPP
jgi:hypothetical protein